MNLLLRYLAQRRKLVGLALICAIANQVFVLLDPLILRYAIDAYATKSNRYTTHQFIMWATLLLCAGMAAALIAWLAKTVQLDAVTRVTRGVGLQLYADAIGHSLGMPYAAFETQQSGQVMAVIQTARADVERFIPLLINSAFSSFVAAVFIVLYAGRINWALVPAFLIALPLVGLANVLLGGKLRDKQKEILSETTRLTASATESLRNIEVVKSLGLARRELSRISDRSGRILAMEVEKIRHARHLSIFHGICVHLLRSGLLFLFLYLVFTKQITLGEFLSLFFYSAYIFIPLQELGSLATVYPEAHASLENIQLILASPQERRPDQPPAIGPLQEVAFRNVCFKYPSGDQPAVSNISLKVTRGETIAFVGPSGSGKTTLVKLLAGLYLPDSGEILYNGRSAAQLDLDLLRERIGLVTQDAQLFTGTIRDNLLFVRSDATDEECLQALTEAAATQLLARADDGLDTLIGEGGVRVSGGERQRISIARALLRNAELLVFDEATSSLDSLTEEEIVATIRSIHRQRDVVTVLISHRLSTVVHADRIYVLQRGKFVACGGHDELMQVCQLYQDLWRRQISGGLRHAVETAAV